MFRIFLYYIIFLFCLSCEDYSDPRIYKLKKNTSLNIDSVNFNDEKFLWKVPDNWLEIPGNSFSIGMYEIKNAESYSTVSITQFPGDAGGIEENVNRWRRQIGLTPKDNDKIIFDTQWSSNLIGKFSIHEIKNNDKPEAAFLCMILPLKNSTVFVKLNTSLENLNKIKNEFYNFCSSFKYIK